MTAPSKFLRRRAIENRKYLIVKRHGVWWRITHKGFCQPCSSWRMATRCVPWARRLA